MKLLLVSLLILIQIYLTSAHGGHNVPKPVQLCQVNDGRKTDMCLALTSHTNTSTNSKDLQLHLSVRFFEERTGWAAFGIGEKMHSGLMFVMYPGANEGDITVSVRSTTKHHPPEVVQDSPAIRITRTWIDDLTGTHNAQLICYDCESWKGNDLNVESTSQSWIWAVHNHQPTQSNDPNLQLKKHTDFGVTTLNMKSSFFEHGDGIVPEVSAHRVSTPRPGLNWVVVHGLLLSGGFFVLTPGIFAIRSGLAKSFSIHWMIQLVSSVAIALGCMIGIKISFAHGTFTSLHQLFGYLVPVAIILQCLFGYFHHLSFVKLGRRTKTSHYHIWLGRCLLIGGNFNIGLGLKLAQAHNKAYVAWFISLVVQMAILIPMWYFSRNGKRTLGSGKQQRTRDDSGYEGVEQDAFIVDDELDEDEDNRKHEDMELK